MKRQKNNQSKQNRKKQQRSNKKNKINQPKVKLKIKRQKELRKVYDTYQSYQFQLLLHILYEIYKVITPETHNNIIFNQMYPVQQYQIQDTFPYIQASDYSSQDNITEAFPHLKNINVSRQWNAKKNIDGVIIRSANDDNVHKAIKYGIWATTSKNRTKLSQLYTRARIENKEVYLFFSVVKSGMFQGVARLVSGLTEENFPFWWDDFNMKFKGFFKIEWVYLKDVNFRHLEGLYNIDNQQVTKSKDCDLIDSATTIKMLNIFDNKPIKNKWIFNDFPYMDKRQRQYTRKLQSQNSQGYQFPVQYQNYQNYGFIPGMGVSQYSTNMGMNVNKMNNYGNYGQQGMPFPPQMMKPSLNKDSYPKQSELGFQMNPVSSKQPKKK